MKIVSTGINTVLLSAQIILLTMITAAYANTAPPKQRVQQEFRRLEAAIARCIYDDVLASHDVEEMNQTLYAFMQDNPGVIRILRANAGGITVNDVRSDAPMSAPPRNIGGQQWFRNVSQNRRTHYSMDVDSMTNEITLFYAWPLMTGADGSRFSGAFAAMIDFTAQAALIDDAEPFQIAFGGRVFFEHDWEDADYNEEPLEVRGTSGLTIRTMRAPATILDPRPRRERQERASGADMDADDMDDDEYIASLLGDTRPRPKRSRLIPEEYINVYNGIFVLLFLIAVMLGYMIITGRRGSKRFVRDTGRNVAASTEKPIAQAAQPPVQPMPPSAQTIAEQQPQPSQQPAPQTPAATEKPVPKPGETGLDLPVVNVETIADGDLYKIGKESDMNKSQKDAIGQMLKLIKDELVIMDRKINLLARKVGELEKK